MGHDKTDPPSRILLADADAFYVAVARLIDPDGAGRQPLLVVGGAPERRGVVTSASYEARASGVHSGMPMAQALRLCPGAVRVPVPSKACRQKSREIRGILERFTPVVEAASIDEFYLDLIGTEQLYGGEPLGTTAARIRRAVVDETGLTVSIGGGSSKLVAKLAARRAKPRRRGDASGVLVVPAGEEAAFLAQLKLADIPGIGPRLEERLARRGLYWVKDALELDEPDLSRWLGDRTGSWLYTRIRGVDTSPVVRYSEAKSLSREETFARDLYRDEDLERELVRLASRVAADLRSKMLRARTITVKLRDADFTTRQRSRTLPHPVDADRPIHSAARDLLRRARGSGGARLLGVSLSNLAPPDDVPAQISLFESRETEVLETERDRTLARTVDDISARFGPGRIVRGSELGPGNQGT